MVVCWRGSGFVPRSGSPTAVVDDKSRRTSLASLTRLRYSVHQCPARSCYSHGSAEPYWRIILTRLGVSVGLAWSISAAAPATAGVAIDVPFRYIMRRLSTGLIPASNCGLCATSRLSTACAWTILFPQRD